MVFFCCKSCQEGRQWKANRRGQVMGSVYRHIFSVRGPDGHDSYAPAIWTWLDWHIRRTDRIVQLAADSSATVPVKCRGRHPGRVLTAAEVIRRASKALDDGYDTVTL